jgi:pyridoxal phosphate enzyme, YggS family
MTIKNNIEKFRAELGNCQLIAVSKTQPNEKIKEGYDAGQRIFGENKVQEMVGKYEVLPKDIEWHLIGHLQSNKVKYIAPFVALIHSTDSVKLLQEIDKQAKKVNRVIPCLLQVHIAKEETKFGFSKEEIFQILKDNAIAPLTNIKVTGLMGMATLTEDEAQIKNEFAALRLLFDQLKKIPLPPNIEMKELSMGMSSDYKIAAGEGSTMVRIGTSIFGSRS